MNRNLKLKLWGFFWVAVVLFLFVLFSYFIQERLEFFEGFVMDGVFGMGSYVLLNILAVVLAPITVLPLIVLAVGLWGVFGAVFLTVVGWSIGSFVAFGLARKFGVPIVSKLVSLEEVYSFEKRVKMGNGFWSVLFLRMIIPVDVLSYALGLFSRVEFLPYAFATVLGIIPFCFVFAYLGEVPYVYQIVFGLIFLVGVLAWLILNEVSGKKN